jgi:hypothetical protein
MRGRLFFLLLAAVLGLALSVAAPAQTLTITSPNDQAELPLGQYMYGFYTVLWCRGHSRSAQMHERRI